MGTRWVMSRLLLGPSCLRGEANMPLYPHLTLVSARSSYSWGQESPAWYYPSWPALQAFMEKGMYLPSYELAPGTPSPR